MTTTQQREEVVKLIEEAKATGARATEVCKIIGIDIRTLLRWKPAGEEAVRKDQRTAQPNRT